MKNISPTPIIIICGATATGKTGLALSLAKKFKGEIISADSRQVYDSMDIGTGKEVCDTAIHCEKGVGQWIINSIPIHLYDVVAPDKDYSVSHFFTHACRLISEITERKKIPFIVGGTGFYLRSLTGNITTLGIKPDMALREKYETLLLEGGVKALADELISLDPKSAKRIDLKNSRRLIRALEVFHTKRSRPEKEAMPNLRILWIGLRLPREKQYEKADLRIDTMIQCGLVDEVENLLEKGYGWDLPSMSGVGYRQFKPYFDDGMPLAGCIQQLKWDTHAYIRRQETWFRRQKEVRWFDPDEKESIKEIEILIRQFLKRKTS